MSRSSNTEDFDEFKFFEEQKDDCGSNIDVNNNDNNNNNNNNNNDNDNVETDNCKHIETYDDGVKTVCMNCGQEINCDSISFDKEWKHRSSDSRKSQRCTQRKQETKDIMDDIQQLDIPMDVKRKANEIFMKIAEGKIFRGDNRKGMMYTCVTNAFDHYPEYEQQKDVIYLQNFFNIPRNIISKSSSQFKLLLHESGLISHQKKVYVTPKHYIPSFISNIGGGDTEVKEVLKLYDLIGNNKSRILSVSRPESYAAGLVYHYYIQKKNQTDINKFVKDSNCGLSALTIKKNMEEIDRILAKRISS